MIKLAFIIRKDGFILTRLANFFTGCRCHHVGFHDIETDTFYDMNWVKRGRLNISRKYNPSIVVHVDCPVNITVADLEKEIVFDNTVYGIMDYLLFSVRWVYRAVGKLTPNMKGTICSEWCHDVLVEKGWTASPFIGKEVPSPCDLLRHFTDLGD